MKEWEERQKEKKNEELRRAAAVDRLSVDKAMPPPVEEKKIDPLADVKVPKDQPKKVNDVKKTEWPAPEPGLNKSPSNVDEHLLKKRAPPVSEDPRKGTSEEKASNSLKDKLNINSDASDSGTVSNDAPVSGGIVGTIPVYEEEIPDPKPKSHKEYVKIMLDEEKIPPGFVNINSRRYILR